MGLIKRLLISSVLVGALGAIGAGIAFGVIDINNKKLNSDVNSVANDIKNGVNKETKKVEKQIQHAVSIVKPSLYLKNPEFVNTQEANQSFNPITQSSVYLDPNLNLSSISTQISSIQYSWYATNSEYDYGGILLGESNNKSSSNGVLELNSYELNAYSYVYFIANVTLDSGMEASYQSSLVKLNKTNAITGLLQITENSKPVTQLSSELNIINSSDPYELSISNSDFGSNNDITYEWYGSKSSNSPWQTPNSTFINPNGWINLTINDSSTSANTLTLNQNIIEAGFTNFAVVIYSNGKKIGLLSTSITYTSNTPISAVNISFSGKQVKSNTNYVYKSQSNDFSSINVDFTYTSSSTSTSTEAIIKYFGYNKTTNTNMQINSAPGFTLLDTQTINLSSSDGKSSYALTANNSYYQQYYAVISVGDYVYTTSMINNEVTTLSQIPSSSSSTSSSSDGSTSSSIGSSSKAGSASSTTSGTKTKTAPKILIPTITEKLNNLNSSQILSQNSISSLSQYFNDYNNSTFKTNLMNDLLSSSSVKITNINYSATEITSITVANNSKSNVNLDWSDGTSLLTLTPNQTKTIGVKVPIINSYSFASMTSNLNLTSLYNGSGSAQNALNQYYNEMYDYDGARVTDVAPIYGFLSTNFNSNSAYTSYNPANEIGSSHANEITSNSWTVWYDSYYPTQNVQLSWMADILGYNSNEFDGYSIYVSSYTTSSPQTVTINKINYYGVWYNVDYILTLGSKFTIYSWSASLGSE
ncbi:MAG: hypothetical protein IIT78_01995 [Mycoplasmataceae bacterium]|nr:hypothetical protein [Mycoplasmataceae bacterium]